MDSRFKIEVEKTVVHLCQGHVILYPTDTIWGLGCDATMPQAVEKILDIKGREADKGMLVLLDDSSKLDQYVVDLEEEARLFAEQYPKPLTLIYPKGRGVAPQLQPADGSIAIRLVKHAFVHAVIAALGHPLVSTSANFSGEATAQQFADILPSLKDKVDYVVDWERDAYIENKASTLALWKNQGKPVILRP